MEMKMYAAFFQQFAVHVHDVAHAGAFVQVVNVLGDEGEVVAEVSFEPDEGVVGEVWLAGEELGAPLVVELVDEFGIDGEGAGGGDFLDFVAFPEAVGAPEGFEAGFCGDAGACEDENALHRVSG